MPIYGLEKNFGPKEWFPRCIWVNPWTAQTLNAVGLAGPGAQALMDAGLLDEQDVFMISFMSTKKTPGERLLDFKKFVALLKQRLGDYPEIMVGIQFNQSCPNTGLDPNHMIDEGLEMFDLSGDLKIPKLIKWNFWVPIEAAKKIIDHPECDGFIQTNAVPFDTMDNHAPGWIVRNFPKGSPLRNRDEKFGGGGYSGPELLDRNTLWIVCARDAGVTKPVVFTGGIRHSQDVARAVHFAGLRRGVDAVSFASAAMVRPWNVRGIIRTAHDLLG
jgi:dihydroorotate dehydrogenase